MSVRDYFPAYGAFGLRELAVARDDQEILIWVEQVLPRSFDALVSDRKAEFVSAAAMMAAELRPALARAEALMSEHPHAHDPMTVAAEMTLVVSARNNLELRERSSSSSAEAWAEVLDVVLSAVSEARVMHEGDR